ncbi:hypothetical protein HAPAU_15080 [Halalkalicoccus paucihalophilus]|uniref:DUF7282 domain-containing protein n=1 Tax=Halalkalicoccus paucihalophilus TaxID=1008153 RepID=A0A151AFP5_9EURY|nr:hypothetical protein [Halalkalicoccus paucihalophilus]KYH26410.1 hypothetical protein HAPAU_15080 [Halalkalicoccus paucihalophilus]
MSDNSKQPTADEPVSTPTTNSSRRRVLQAVGGTAAALAFTGSVSAMDDDDVEYTPSEHQRPEGPLGEGKGLSYSRFSDQVTDGTYVIVDEGNITTEEGGFMSVHIARPEEGIADVGFINPETGEPQNAAATIIGYSEYLEPGLHQNIKVPILQDEELDAVSGELDRLPEPAVLVSLPHVDSNENEEWDFFDEGDEDGAYGFEDIGAPTDGSFAPPGPDRPTDIAAVVPLEENEDDFHISRPDDDLHNGEVEDDDNRHPDHD